ncbi:MAG: hypothetical protein VZR36_06485 [Prevotella sp.]|nr:hypothetical protein [Prevotella sp.]
MATYERKLKLYREFAELNNRIIDMGYTANGFDAKIDISDEEMMLKHANYYNLKELKYSISRAKSVLENLEFNKRYSEYINTDEGREHMQRLDAAIANGNEILMSCGKEYRDKFNKLIADNLGENWGAKTIDGTNLEIGLYENDERKFFEFGRSFDVWTNMRIRGNGWDEPLHMSYGTTGAFSLSDDASNGRQPEFLAGMAQFANSKLLHNTIKTLMKEFSEKYDDITESLSKLEAERKNPFKD